MFWWESDFLKADNNRLKVAGTWAADLARRHGTPLFVYSRERIRKNYDRLHGLLSDRIPKRPRLCYALKANPHPEILDLLQRAGAGVDAVSPGEVDAALAAGFPPERILFTGTSVSRADLRSVFAREGVTVTVDAEEQLPLMKAVRDSDFPGREISVSVRWNPGIGSGFSPKTVTAGTRSPDGTPIKFGVPEDRVLDVYRRAEAWGFLPVGFHQHLGSGWVGEDFSAVRRAVDRMIAKARDIQNLGIKLEFLDFGGGFGPVYAESQSLFPLESYIDYISRCLEDSGLEIESVVLEPGKYLVGDAGITLLCVEYVKHSLGHVFACVNCGTFNSVPRPPIYTQAYHHILNVDSLNSDEEIRITVAGDLCETGDVFGREILLPLPAAGDVLAVLCTGAYCRSMASNFNLRPIPPEVFL